MNYGSLRKFDIANGDGIRVSLFVSGCNHHCKGCFNEEAWDFDYGKPFTNETLQELLAACDDPGIQGLSLLGGEPMDPKNQPVVRDIVRAFRERFGHTKDIWMWTGYHTDEFYHEYDTRCFVPGCTYDILKEVDIVVDGPFDLDKKDISLKFRGSSNQRIVHLVTGDVGILKIEN